MPDTEKLVTINRLKTLLDAYGAAPECWPEEERAAATALIETSSEARALVEDAAALDSLLDKIPEPEVSAALTSRIRSMALPPPQQQASGFVARLTEFLRPQTPRAWQGAVAMAGILGMIAGIGVSMVVLDRAEPVPRVVATAPPATNVAAAIDPDTVETSTASLAPDLATYSMTGEDVAENASESNTQLEPRNDDNELIVADIPLY